MRGPLLLSVLCATIASSLVGAAPAPLSPRESIAGHRLAIRGPGDDATTRRTSSARIRAEATTRGRAATTAARVATTTPARAAVRTTSAAAATTVAVRTAANVRETATTSLSATRGRTVTVANSRATPSSARASSAGVFSDAAGFFNSLSKAFPWVILAIVSLALLVIIGSFYLIKRRCYKGHLKEIGERGDSDSHSNCSQFTYYGASSTNLYLSDTVNSRHSSSGSEILDEYEDEKDFDEDEKPLGFLEARAQEKDKAAYLGWDTLPPSAAKPPCALYFQPRRASCYAEPVRPEPTLQLSTRQLQEQARRSSNSLILPPVAANSDGTRSALRASTPPPSYRSASAPSAIQSQRAPSPNPHPLLMLRNTHSSSTLVELRSVDPASSRLSANLPPVPRPYQPSVGSSLKYALSDDSHNSDAYAV
ncbi:BQ2448_6639 [Microbotryum intermedium]|uniref:BQ2448_6639 protein n=1 Tax=Microbotryum intermedium TaxID=269621 RepID=A0A238FLS5_9BASI|nr:BQ2448_6639 [Microbotryum intermedium]